MLREPLLPMCIKRLYVVYVSLYIVSLFRMHVCLHHEEEEEEEEPRNINKPLNVCQTKARMQPNAPNEMKLLIIIIDMVAVQTRHTGTPHLDYIAIM